MSYPSYALNEGSDVETDYGAQAERATNGALRGRSFYSSGKKKFKVIHWLSTAQLASYRAYLGGLASTSDTFLWVDGSTYTVTLGDDGVKETYIGGGFTETEATLLEV